MLIYEDDQTKLRIISALLGMEGLSNIIFILLNLK